MPPPETVKGRPPCQGGGPDAISAHTIATMISARPLTGREPARWRLDALPAHIADRITVSQVSGCWIVGGSTDRDGYARIGGRGAHRVIWEHLEDEVPLGLVLDHREDWGCISKACGFPGHLLPVTRFVNSTRPGAGGVGALNAAKTECDHGHAYDLFNTYWRPDGHRDCRTCIRRRVAEYKGRQRAAADVLELPLAGLGRAA